MYDLSKIFVYVLAITLLTACNINTERGGEHSMFIYRFRQLENKHVVTKIRVPVRAFEMLQINRAAITVAITYNYTGARSHTVVYHSSYIKNIEKNNAFEIHSEQGAITVDHKPYFSHYNLLSTSVKLTVNTGDDKIVLEKNNIKLHNDFVSGNYHLICTA